MNRIIIDSPKHGINIALVDDDDYEKIGHLTWHINGSGYATGNVDGKQFFMHRWIMKAPKGTPVDHINKVKLDNRKENLRLCTYSQNNGYRDSIHSNVHWDKTNHRWLVHCQGKHKGSFLEQDKIAALNCANHHMLETFGKEFAVLSDCPYMSINEWKAKALKRRRTSSYHGVGFHKFSGKWRASKSRHDEIGYFKSELEAAQAYDREIKRSGLNKPLNFS